jgi:hypothetical protein
VSGLSGRPRVGFESLSEMRGGIQYATRATDFHPARAPYVAALIQS